MNDKLEIGKKRQQFHVNRIEPFNPGEVKKKTKKQAQNLSQLQLHNRSPTSDDNLSDD